MCMDKLEFFGESYFRFRHEPLNYMFKFKTCNFLCLKMYCTPSIKQEYRKTHIEPIYFIKLIMERFNWKTILIEKIFKLINVIS